MPKHRVQPAVGHPIVVVGAANMDLGARAHHALATQDSTPGYIACTPGGVARNVAENLARLGNWVRLISPVGDDAFGDMVVDATTQAGVDLQCTPKTTGDRTATYLSVHDANGELVFGINDMAILDGFGPAQLAGYTKDMQAAPCVVLDCNLPRDTLEWVLSDARMPPVWVDGVSVAKCLRLKGLLSGIDTWKLNQWEAHTLSGLPTDSVERACHAAQSLHDQGPRVVMITLGVLGVCWCDESGRIGHQGPRALQITNTSGAGDALLAGLVHGYSHSMAFADCVEFAMACAGLTLSSPRANHPELSVQAVTAFMTQNAP